MCDNLATLMLIDGPGPDDYTLSCAEHEEEMKSDTHIGSFPFTGDAPCCYIAAPSQRLELRPEVLAFAEAMELKLRKHDDWGQGWKFAPIDSLMRDLSEHYYKLASRVFSEDATAEDVMSAAADIGNFAMFIADVFVPHSEREEVSGRMAE